jgi:hypothetical protein
MDTLCYRDWHRQPGITARPGPAEGSQCKPRAAPARDTISDSDDNEEFDISWRFRLAAERGARRDAPRRPGWKGDCRPVAAIGR